MTEVSQIINQNASKKQYKIRWVIWLSGEQHKSSRETSGQGICMINCLAGSAHRQTGAGTAKSQRHSVDAQNIGFLYELARSRDLSCKFPAKNMIRRICLICMIKKKESVLLHFSTEIDFLLKGLFFYHAYQVYPINHVFSCHQFA